MKPSVILYAVFLTVSLGIKAQQADTVSYEVTKNMPVFYEQLKQQLTYPAAWGKSTTKDFGKWRIETRNIVMECMQNLPPAPAKYDMSVVGTEQRSGYEARKIWFNVSEWSRIPAYLLVPDGKGPFPAVIMLHDHGAHFSIGKEKMVCPFGVSPEISADAEDWVVRCYDGQYTGDYFAQNGYVVLSIDALFWGERGRKEGVSYDGQQALASNFMQMGASWGAFINMDDVRSAEFLASLPMVDKNRVGCLGFSMGAYRSWMLAALTDCVKASASICWMNTTEHLMTLTNNQNKGGSAYSMLIPNLRRYLDYPHTASIACPKPALFFNGSKDKLFPIEGVRDAYQTMRTVWDSQHAGDRLVTKIWDEKHFFNKEMQEGLINTYKESGFFPEWASPVHRGCMIGNNSASVLADAYLKGFTGFDADRAYRYMVASSVYEKQNGVPYVLEKGYIPCDKVREATSIAMEYAADDWGIALMAKKMGKTEDYQNYLKRGKYYTQYFDKDINFIRPKMNDGSWRTPYDPIQSIHSVGDFCEGNGWHYTFFVPQHPEGLIELMGGDAPFISKLDSLFLVEGELGENASPDISGLIGMYAHGNEPSHHVTYLYPYAGEQWKTAEKVRYIQDVFYTDQPEGIIGNEDCGQMSAWHIMSALGFYQVNPSNGVFVFGSPLFDKASVHLPEGKTFEVVAQNNSKENVYIQSVLLNGKPYNNSYILYDDIVKGGNLTFVMGNTPNKEFGAAPENRPKTAE